MSAVQQLRPGLAHYDPGAGDPTRWGDYSLTSADPVDDTFWTIQEYAGTGNNWRTWIGHFGNPCSGPPDCNGNGIRDSCDITSGTSLDNNGDGIPDECEGFVGMVFCAGDGLDPQISSLCPCFNFGTPGNGCSNSLDAAGGSMRASGVTTPTDSLSFTVSHLPPATNVVFVKGNTLRRRSADPVRNGRGRRGSDHVPGPGPAVDLERRRDSAGQRSHGLLPVLLPQPGSALLHAGDVQHQQRLPDHVVIGRRAGA